MHVSVDADKDEDTQEVKKTENRDREMDRESPPREHRRKMLHKTCSIFLRNLAPSITKQEVEAVRFLIFYTSKYLLELVHFVLWLPW